MNNLSPDLRIVTCCNICLIVSDEFLLPHRVAGEVEGVVKAWLSAYRPVIDPLVQAFNGQMESIQQLPVVMYLNTIAQRIQLQVSDLNKHLELEVRARNVLRQALQQVDKMCVQLAKDLKVTLAYK